MRSLPPASAHFAESPIPVFVRWALFVSEDSYLLQLPQLAFLVSLGPKSGRESPLCSREAPWRKIRSYKSSVELLGKVFANCWLCDSVVAEGIFLI